MSEKITFDWDYVIGHWIKDIPYLWTNAKTWQQCERNYLVPNLNNIQVRACKIVQVREARQRNV
jgi:hypothetical protein